MTDEIDVDELGDRTVAQLLAEDYRRARVFGNHNIDFCCGGERTLETVCEERGVDLESLVRDLRGVSENATTPRDSFTSMEPEELIDLVQEKHHEFTEEAIRRISGYVNKVRKVHGENHPEVVELADLWVELGSEMLQHMQREDDLLFPYARKILNAEDPGTVDRPQGKSAKELIESMEGEHDEAGDRLYDIKDLTNEFTPPEDACTTFRALYSDLEEFVEVTMEHVYIENSVLFPEIIEAEQQVSKL